MFNYTKEVIINEIDKYKFLGGQTGTVTELRIPRVANYKKEFILDGKYYRTEPVSGAAGKVTITLPTGITGADIMRLTLFLSTPDVELAEFGTPCWQDFGKPIIVEVAAKADVARVVAAVKLAAGEYVDVQEEEEKVVITGKEKWMDFQDVAVVLLKVEDNKETEVEPTTAAKVDITHAIAEFGTAEWIDHTLRFPSAPNRRYSPLFADELPVRGAKYVQYVFKYIARHNVPGGLSGVDQCVDSITSHVFYVREGEVDEAFKKAIDKVATAAPITGEEGSAKTAPVASMNPYSAGAQAADVATAKAAADDVAKKLAAIAAVKTEDAEVKKIVDAAATV